MAQRASLTQRSARREAAALPDVQIYGGAGLAVLGALVVGTADGQTVRLTLGMLLVAASVILALVGSVRLGRLARERRGDFDPAGTAGCAAEETRSGGADAAG